MVGVTYEFLNVMSYGFTGVLNTALTGIDSGYVGMGVLVKSEVVVAGVGATTTLYGVDAIAYIEGEVYRKKHPL